MFLLERAIIAIALVVVLIFSGFLFRSFGRGEQGQAAGHEKSIK